MFSILRYIMVLSNILKKTEFFHLVTRYQKKKKVIFHLNPDFFNQSTDLVDAKDEPPLNVRRRIIKSGIFEASDHLGGKCEDQLTR